MSIEKYAALLDTRLNLTGTVPPPSPKMGTLGLADWSVFPRENYVTPAISRQTVDTCKEES